MCAHKKRRENSGRNREVHLSAKQLQITKWRKSKLGTGLTDRENIFFSDSKETLNVNFMTVVIFQVTYYKRVLWAPMKHLMLPLQREENGWNSSSSSGGTQPFAAQTLIGVSARKCLFCTLGGYYWKAKSLFLQDVSSITLRLSKKRVSVPRLECMACPARTMTTWRHLHSNLALFFLNHWCFYPEEWQ